MRLPKKKRTKKFNPIHTQTKIIESTFERYKVGILYIGSNQFCDFISFKTLKKELNTINMCNSIMEYPLKWTVINAVFMIESNGKYKIDYEELAPVGRCLQSQMSDALTMYHKKLIDGLLAKNLGKNIVNIGWFAVPFNFDLDENIERLTDMFELHGAFSNKAKFVNTVGENIIPASYLT